MTEVFIALGSNIEPERYLPAAVEALAEQFELLDVSPVYQGAPVGASSQPDYLNAAVLVRTCLTPAQCKAALREIEDSLGRVRTADKFASRIIDLDIVLFGDQVLELGARHIPDPDLLLHAHVAVPIAALRPKHVHPETDETLAMIASRLGNAGLELRPDIALAVNRN